MIKLLAIGNSFSQDAARYLHDIAKADHIDIKVVNLFIGGCSLETHWDNILSDAAAYDYELNGQGTGRKISIKDALQEEAWDYITLQQVSGDSGKPDTYYPYITQIHSYVRQFAPQATCLLHQTWAYEIDSDHPAFSDYHNDQLEMYASLADAYKKVAKDLSLNIIPSGKVIQKLRTKPLFDYANGGVSLCRDGFHMSLVYGRYAVAATWYEYILGQNILSNQFVPPEINGETAGEEELRLIKETVHQIVSEEYNM